MENKILTSLFDSLNRQGYGYCVLRNYENLPYSLGKSDLDLAVLPDQIEQVAKLVIRVAKDHGGEPIIDYVASGRMIRLLGCHQGVWWGVAIDLFWMIEYRGVEYIQTSEVIGRAVEYRGIKVARDDDAAVIALAKELLSNGKTRKTYFQDLSAIYQEQGAGSLYVMYKTFSIEAVSSLAELLAKEDDRQNVITLLSKALRRDVFQLRGNQKIEGMLRNAMSRMHRLVKPAGASIVVMGTDGSGKTTLINHIKPVLERAIHNELQYEHLRPNWLPALGVATGKREAGDGSPETDPHKQNPSRYFGSLIRLGYYCLDYTLGYWLKIFPRLVKRPHICVFDRYYYDFIIDPKRMRISLPEWVLRMVLSLIPQPDLVLCLVAEPEVIFKRKPETSLEEVSMQVEKLKRFCFQNERAYWVDTGTAVDESVHDILHLIRGAMSSRYY